MSNKFGKARTSAAKELFKRPEGPFKPIDLATTIAVVPPGLTRAFMNTRYVVMIYDDVPTTHGPAIKALVQKHDNTPIVNHWSEMNKIKNEIFGDEVLAIEYYPRKSELVDDFNLYWLMVYPVGVIPEVQWSKN